MSFDIERLSMTLPATVIPDTSRIYTMIAYSDLCVELASKLEALRNPSSKEEGHLHVKLRDKNLFDKLMEIQKPVISMRKEIYKIGERLYMDKVVASRPSLGKVLSRKLVIEVEHDAVKILSKLKNQLQGINDNLQQLKQAHFSPMHLHSYHSYQDQRDIIKNLNNSIEEVQRIVKTTTLDKFLCNADPKPGYTDSLSPILFEFKQYAKSLSQPERENLSLEHAPIWKHITGKEQAVKKYREEKETGDGDLYNEKDFGRTEYVMEIFDLAWKVENQDTHVFKAVERLPEMIKISLILKTMGQEKALQTFVNDKNRFIDKNLPMDKKHMNSLEKIFGATNYDEEMITKRFLAEQHRAVSIKWLRSRVVELDDLVVLPFSRLESKDSGSYGHVDYVEDGFSREKYARKIQTEMNDTSTELFEKEIAALLHLGYHRHVVQLLKCYRRQNQYGLILSAGEGPISKILKKICNDKPEFDPDQNDAGSPSRELLRAFGCLSSGLMYIHTKKVRHKDIKPDNIIYARQKNSEAYNFFFIDFNISYDFSSKSTSGTHNQSRLTPKYAAPEMVHWMHGQDKWDARVHWPGMQQENHQNNILEKDDTHNHGRSAEIWSLGVVFMEMLSSLTEKDNLLETPREDSFRGCAKNGVYFDAIERLQSWSNKMISRIQKESPDSVLIPVFRISQKMIHPDPHKRPKIDEIVKHFHRNGGQYFCDECLSERQQ